MVAPRLVRSRAMGPAWLGIGAQRSGTTWFADLLLQHPEMTLSTRGIKELHYLYNPKLSLRKYRELFEGCAGEWTPVYLRHLSVPRAAAKVLNSDSLVLVMLRDPVERYASAMRHVIRRYEANGRPRTLENLRLVNSDVTWGGMYASQLAEWARHVGRKRMMVLQYEAVVKNPQTYADQVWRRLGLSPVPLTDVEKPSRTSASDVAWTWEDGVQDTLTRLYEPEAHRLVDWGIDLSLWPRFSPRAKASRSLRMTLTRSKDRLRRIVRSTQRAVSPSG